MKSKRFSILKDTLVKKNIANWKMVGRKSSVIHDSDKYNSVLQRASIYQADNSFESGAVMDQYKMPEREIEKEEDKTKERRWNRM